MGAPFEIPPWTPPELFVLVVSRGRLDTGVFAPNCEGGIAGAWMKGSL